jgi:hypothetical protein
MRAGRSEKIMTLSNRILTGISILVFSVSWPLLAFPQNPGIYIGQAFSKLVVSLSSEMLDGSLVEGFGIVVGEYRRQPLIITANHNVRALPSGQLPKKIKVRYHGDVISGEAKALEFQNPSRDLAVLVADPPKTLEDFKTAHTGMGCLKTLKKEEPLWFIGRSATWYIPLGPGRFKGHATKGGIVVEGLDILPSSSGAPLIAQNGLIGMIITDEGMGKTSTALSMDWIKEEFKNWKLPWHLYFTDLAAQLCIKDLPGTEEGLLAFADLWLRPGAKSSPLDVVPARNDYRAVFEGKYAEMAEAHYREHYGGLLEDFLKVGITFVPAVDGGPPAGRDWPSVVGRVTTDTLRDEASKIMKAGEYLGGWHKASLGMRRGLTIYGLRVGSSDARISGFIYVNGRWLCFPKPWEFIQINYTPTKLREYDPIPPKKK